MSAQTDTAHATPTTRAQRWGVNVAAKREDAGMSQRDLADGAGTTQQTISRIELGQQTPSDGLRVGIAKVLGCKAGELFGYEDA